MSTRHIHLDPVGGIAGDMFAAAMLCAFPDLTEPCLSTVRQLVGNEADVTFAEAHSKGFAGARFQVAANTPAEHRSWRQIARTIDATMPTGAKEQTLGIFRLLAEAEAAVHGVAPDDVHFHEVGAVDSIADIAAAGFLIDEVSADSWSVGPLSLGGGLARTAHGTIPVPAPATVHLLKGFAVVDDGVPGERVTPTGAAILAHLKPVPVRPSGAIGETGLGLGTRELPDRVNGLRVLEIVTDRASTQAEVVAVLRFDIDDQTAEDLAFALDRLRAVSGVIDVTQATAIGKKGRMTAQIRLLAKPDQVETVTDHVFGETTTLGLCIDRTERRVLAREHVEPMPGLRAKRARRPDGVTAKAEFEDIARQGGDAADRAQLRRDVERAALGAEVGQG